MSDRVDTVIFDVDGTLVDSNYQHALAWFRAFRRFEITVPVWQIHRAIGMGGDRLVSHVAGESAEAEHGDALREAWAEEFEPMIGEVQPLSGVTGLLRAVKRCGCELVLASSGQAEHVETFLDLFDGTSLADAWTTANDADSSKPAPDLLRVALDRVGGRQAVMVGDATWDAVAAGQAGMRALAILTGGFSRQELLDAGAARVFHHLGELRDAIEDNLIATL